MHRSGPGIVAVVREAGGSPEVERLGNELRTTIEELLRARRTIDLQRGELERSSTVDPLTGVASRGAILERLRMEVAQARRYRHPLGVVLLDVDRFADINSAHGIGGGDAVLREVARVLRNSSREIDHPARYGGEELAVVLPGTDLEGAFNRAERIRTEIEALRIPRLDGAGTLSITTSCGVAAARAHAADGHALVQAADNALYEAKHTGKNTSVRAR